MASRRLLICTVSLGAVLAGATIGAFAIGSAQTNTTKAEVGSCAAYSGLPAEDGDRAGMVFVRGGAFVMGSERHQREERFTHIVRVDGFWIDRHEVTNAEFARIQDSTMMLTMIRTKATTIAMPGTNSAPSAVFTWLNASIA
jgi:formylglycine-generating enzyme